jgi:hypothetical protein
MPIAFCELFKEFQEDVIGFDQILSGKLASVDFLCS